MFQPPHVSSCIVRVKACARREGVCTACEVCAPRVKACAQPTAVTQDLVPLGGGTVDQAGDTVSLRDGFCHLALGPPPPPSRGLSRSFRAGVGAGGRAWTSPPGRVCDPVLMQNRADAQLHTWGTCCTAGSTPTSSCHLLALCQPKSSLAPLPVPLAGPTAPRDTDLRLPVAREGAPLSGRLPSCPGSRPVSLWCIFSWAVRLLPSRSNKSFVSSLRAACPRAPVFPVPSAGPRQQ